MFTSERAFAKYYKSKLTTIFGKEVEESTNAERYYALAQMVREEMNRR